MPKQSADLKSTRLLKLLTLSAAVVALSGMVACSNAPTSQTGGGANSTPNSTPAVETSRNQNVEPSEEARRETLISLRRIANHSERIYGQARRESWGDAEANLDEIQEAFRQVELNANASDLNLSRLERDITRLQETIDAQERRSVMRAANQVVFAAAQLMPPLNPASPTEIILLGYYGRSLDLGGQDEERTKATVSELRKTWDELRPKVESKGATNKAQQFDQLIQQAEAAQERQDYARVGRELVRESKEMTEVFRSRPSN